VSLRDAHGVQRASSDLRERSGQLSALAEMLTAAAHSNGGQVALVYGEAGIGKTALLRRFCLDASGSARVLWGKCDELFTPRPLGPLLDIAEDAGADLAEVLRRRVRLTMWPRRWRTCS